MSFSDSQLYSSKLFLKSLKDSYDCLKEAAERRAYDQFYTHAVQRIVDAKRLEQVPTQYPEIALNKFLDRVQRGKGWKRNQVRRAQREEVGGLHPVR